MFVKWHSLIAGPVNEMSVEVPARAEIAAIAIDEAGLLLGLLLLLLILLIIIVKLSFSSRLASCQ